MKLSNFVLALAFATVPAVAAANNHDSSKQDHTKSIFVVNEDKSFFKDFSKPMVDLDNHYLVGASNKFSSYSKPDDRKQFSVDSFQSKFESENKYSEVISWFGGYKFLTETNSNYFLQAVNDHSAFLVFVVFGEKLKGLDWDQHGWGGHNGSNNHHNWDNTHCDPVPEPTAYALMLAGLLMLGFIKRRKN